MAEPWLNSNRRASLVGALPLLVILLAGIALLIGFSRNGGLWKVVPWLGLALAAIAATMLAGWISLTRRPRLAYENGFLLVHLRVGRPIRVPVEIVECFFLGHGPSHLPGPVGRRTETANVVVRLAERATQWKRVQVHPVFGQWCDGYITIRGAWCQPISTDVVNRLNQRLRDAQGTLRPNVQVPRNET